MKYILTLICCFGFSFTTYADDNNSLEEISLDTVKELMTSTAHNYSIKTLPSAVGYNAIIFHGDTALQLMEIPAGRLIDTNAQNRTIEGSNYTCRQIKYSDMARDRVLYVLKIIADVNAAQEFYDSFNTCEVYIPSDILKHTAIN